eukprot:2351208-Prymnesium_polylepis.1
MVARLLARRRRHAYRRAGPRPRTPGGAAHLAILLHGELLLLGDEAPLLAVENAPNDLLELVEHQLPAAGCRSPVKAGSGMQSLKAGSGMQSLKAGSGMQSPSQIGRGMQRSGRFAAGCSRPLKWLRVQRGQFESRRRWLPRPTSCSCRSDSRSAS